MTRDYQQFPDDENGNLLWQMFEDGNDLCEPHEVEFSIAFEQKEQAEKCALHLLHQEQKISLYQEDQHSEQENLWILNVHVNMILEHEDLVDLEDWFGRIGKEFGGEYDGWGCTSYLFDYEEDEE
ncbi:MULTISPECIES: ribonuclease E inhibitor RraB [unclassified Acinetobacter]|uniref:ribonuclease E inhibitor RraB n=1 Tax=unclassified Acinetobacter TaxID=196816 RepID=UPI00103D6A26|nr:MULTISPECIES: ribonuclease E inhibitor RraB [unclassified Acinetobacter]TCB11033.1 ribonuclease E inhibitor RraB [Acinetobacter sp. ANC 4641]TCB24379.1 ribonuclease E inhibitor RraB [Acinetobacter sp. ANC 4633]